MQSVHAKASSSVTCIVYNRECYIALRCLQDDVVIEHKKREYLQQYDKYLRKFEYGKVLNFIMEVRRPWSLFLFFKII